MNVVWKYGIPARRTIFEHRMPRGARVVYVDTQAHAPQLWVLADADAERVPRRFRLIETGEPFDVAGLEYVGSFITDYHWETGQELTSPYVGHVFEELFRP